jgi:AcrR family transcriptional regulator
MAEVTRRERERRQHRQQILEAAESVFAEKGFHGASVHEIAERAEFSVGYLYNLFENKEGLYAELVSMRAGEHVADVEERLEQTDGVVRKLKTVIEAKFDFFRRHRKFFDIFAHLIADSRAQGPAFMPESCREHYQRYLGRMEKLFRRGIDEGVLVDSDPLTMVLCLEGMTRSIIAHWLYTGAGDNGVDAPALVERVLLNGILAEGAHDE